MVWDLDSKETRQHLGAKGDVDPIRGALKLDSKEQKMAYLAKAKEAEEMAKQAMDPDTRKAWLKVAMSYRSLAECFS